MKSRHPFQVFLATNFALPRFEGGEGEGEGDEKTVTMTQEQFDKVIQDRLERDRKSRGSGDKEQARKALSELQKLQTTLKMTEEEKTALDERVAELEGQILTTDEIQAKVRKQTEEKFKTDLTAAEQRAAAAEQKYANSRTQTELTAAAINNGVLNKSMPFVLSYVAPKSKLVQVVDDDGKPTGADRVVVLHETVDKNGNPETQELSPADFFGQMAEDTENYGNLFDPKKRGGTGTVNGDGTKKTGAGWRPGMTTEEMMKMRKENPEAYYK